MPRKSLKKHIADYYHNANEEMITLMFYSQFRYYLIKVSGKIENEFIEELRMAISYNIAEWQIRLNNLHRNAIGTTDEKVIEEIIALSEGKYFEIKLHWPKDPGKQNEFSIELESNSNSTNLQQFLSRDS